MLVQTLMHYLFSSPRCLLCGDETFEGPLCQHCLKNLPFLKGERCAQCSAPLLSEENICMRCRNRRFSFSENHSLFAYEGAVKELIYQYKFNNEKQLAAVFAQLLFHEYLVNSPHTTVVVPVPARKITIKRRGWDHMETIARYLGNKYNVPVIYCLARRGKTSQKSLNYEGRMHNLNGKIIIKKHLSSLSDKVILIDDVFTTGATLEQCSVTLHSAGVKEVQALTLALD